VLVRRERSSPWRKNLSSEPRLPHSHHEGAPPPPGIADRDTTMLVAAVYRSARVPFGPWIIVRHSTPTRRGSSTRVRTASGTTFLRPIRHRMPSAF
jgi:hypothetical protein